MDIDQYIIQLFSLQEQAENMVLDGASLGLGWQRFLPKAQGVRTIVNLSTKFIHPVSRQETSINVQLSNVFQILNYEKVGLYSVRYIVNIFACTLYI